MFIIISATGYGPELLTLSRFEKRRVHSVACKNQATISTQTACQNKLNLLSPNRSVRIVAATSLKPPNQSNYSSIGRVFLTLFSIIIVGTERSPYQTLRAGETERRLVCAKKRKS